MKTMSRVLAAAIFAIALPLSASAQTGTATTAAPAGAAKLEIGKWTGTVAPPNGDPLDLEFVVSMAHDTMKIELSIPIASMNMSLTNIKLEDKKISFDFDAGGTAVTCKLDKKDDGSYAGPCADASGMGGPMTMVPPKKTAGGGTN